MTETRGTVELYAPEAPVVIERTVDSAPIVIEKVYDRALGTSKGDPGPEGPPGPPGIGEPGPAGPPGPLADPRETFSYTHYQTSPATLWTAVHNLGFVPGGLLVVGSDGLQHDPEIVASTRQATVMSFTSPMTGAATLS